MTKKMTAKEFWKVLNEAGYTFDTTPNYERILNDLCIALESGERTLRNSGCDSAARHIHAVHDAIFAALEDRGYYKEVM